MEEIREVEAAAVPLEETEAWKNAKWYVVHTYSGHENKVKANIEKHVTDKLANLK